MHISTASDCIHMSAPTRKEPKKELQQNYEIKDAHTISHSNKNVWRARGKKICEQFVSIIIILNEKYICSIVKEVAREKKE